MNEIFLQVREEHESAHVEAGSHSDRITVQTARKLCFGNFA